MRSRMRFFAITALLAAGILLLGDAATYAGTGDSLILGQLNKSGKTTTLQNVGTGPALSLKTKASSPPLSVSSKALVRNLNADSVDGLDGKALAHQTYEYVYSDANKPHNSLYAAITGLPAGHYLVLLHTYFFNVDGSPTEPNSIYCTLSDRRFRNLAGNSFPFVGGLQPDLSGSGEVTVKKGEILDIGCGVENGTFTFGSPLELTFTRTNVVSTKQLTAEDF
jgi:hypothetical protein